MNDDVVRHIVSFVDDMDTRVAFRLPPNRLARDARHTMLDTYLAQRRQAIARCNTTFHAGITMEDIQTGKHTHVNLLWNGRVCNLSYLYCTVRRPPTDNDMTWVIWVFHDITACSKSGPGGSVVRFHVDQTRGWVKDP
jgi:hypothetical protein